MGVVAPSPFEAVEGAHERSGIVEFIEVDAMQGAEPVHYGGDRVEWRAAGIVGVQRQVAHGLFDDGVQFIARQPEARYADGSRALRVTRCDRDVAMHGVY